MQKKLHRLFLVMAVSICLITLNACGNTESGNIEPIGFNEATNQRITFQGINFSIPAYYDFLDPSSTEDFLQYYPQNENYDSLLEFRTEDVNITPADFKSLKQFLAESAVEGANNADFGVTITNNEDITVAGLSGFHVAFSQQSDTASGTGHIVLINNIFASKVICILQENDSKDQSDFDYDGDFIKILNSATLTKEVASESIINKSEESATSKPVESPKPSNGEMIGSGDLGDYHVEIKSGTLTEDYDGNPACIITYTWTNNSDETTNALLAIEAKAFQDGVELDRALIFSSDGYDSGAGMKDIRPGSTIDVQCAFTLSNETSNVEFELSKQFDFSKDGPKVVKVFRMS